MRLFGAVVMGLGVMFLLIMALNASQRHFPQDSKLITFVDDTGIQWVDFESGSNTESVPIGNYWGLPTIWSPNSQWIAYFSAYDLYIARGIDGNQRNLDIDLHAYGIPQWSPDGRWIAFNGRISSMSGNDDIYKVRSNGEDVRQLTHTQDIHECCPTWSPDGEWIAYRATQGIYKMRSDGSEQQLLIDMILPASNTSDQSIHWSPNGEWIAFIGNPRDGTHAFNVWRIRADGSDLQQITYGASVLPIFAWSPDSERIAFVSGHNGKNDIYVVDQDGTHLHQLTHTAYTERHLQWSPQGDWITFSDIHGGFDSGLYRINADGTGLTFLSQYGVLRSDFGFFPTTERSTDNIQLLEIGIAFGFVALSSIILRRRHAKT